MDGVETAKCSSCAANYKGVEAEAPFTSCVIAVENCTTFNESLTSKCS